MTVSDLRKRAYEKYQLDWMISHGYAIADICEMADEWKANPEEDLEFFINNLERDGFCGTLWACMDEFLRTEYIDAQYMAYLLTKEEFALWRKDTGNTEKVPDISIDTPLGRIEANVVPDCEFPGVELNYVEPGDDGCPTGAIMEYNALEGKVILMVWGPDNPEGDPIFTLPMSGHYEFNVRPLKEDDLTSVEIIDGLAAEEGGFRVSNMLDCETHAFGAFIGSTLIGYCTVGGADAINFDNALLLSDVFIAKEHRGNGYGSRLVKYAIERQEKQIILAQVLDESLKSFYRELGFCSLRDGLMAITGGNK